MLPRSHPITLFQTPPRPAVGKKAKSLRLQERDVRLLAALQSAGYLTSPQMQALFWRGQPGSKIGPRKACQRRLKQLTTAGLIRRIEQPVKRNEGSKPYIYTLDRNGAHWLTDELGIDPKDIDWRPKPAEENYPFMAHLLAITDVRIAITLACEQTGLVLEAWFTDRELKREGALDYALLTSPDGKEHKAAVIPDSVFVLRRGDAMALFFLEVDRMTTTLAPTSFERRGWSRKVRTYMTYFSGEAFHKRYAGKKAQVLTVTMSEQRLANMKAITEQVEGDNRFWFTTFDQVTPNIITAKCWQRATMTSLYSLLG